jgi:glycosyltransferase involved in cell wall biosynthesis
MKISIFSPVKNEVDFIGYSIMAALPYVHEILYGVAPSDDGTEELLDHIQQKYAKEKLRLFWGHANAEPIWGFDPMNMEAYNRAFNYLIEHATGDAAWFLHPDMIATNPEKIEAITPGPLAWWTHVESYAGDLQTRIAKGRATRWKNIHAKQFGLHYFGGYGSQNEDMYFADITGGAYAHYGQEFDEYPFEIGDSGVKVNHYCELKSYSRRLEKMKLCLKTQHPGFDDKRIEELAMRHPRVTLDTVSQSFGDFAFEPATEPVPHVFAKYGEEFRAFRKQPQSV